MKRWLSRFLCFLLLVALQPAFAWSSSDTYFSVASLPNTVQESITSMDANIFCTAYGGNGNLFVLTRNDSVEYVVSVFQMADSGYELAAQSQPLSDIDGTFPDIGGSDPNALHLFFGDFLGYTFTQDAAGEWRLSAVQGADSYTCDAYYLKSGSEHGTKRSWIYTNTSTASLSQFDPSAFPADFAEAVSLADTDHCGMVSNPSPQDQLNLRTKPSITSVSKGKFYNGTPVYVLEDMGEWIKVRVADLEGYMLKEYIAFDIDMLNVTIAFPALVMQEELYTDGATLYLRADASADISGVVPKEKINSFDFHIIGDIDEGWYYVLCSNGLAGYMPVSDFYEGNG